MLFMTMKTNKISHFEFEYLQTFEESHYIPHVARTSQILNVATKGACDYIALTRQITSLCGGTSQNDRRLQNTRHTALNE